MMQYAVLSITEIDMTSSGPGDGRQKVIFNSLIVALFIELMQKRL